MGALNHITGNASLSGQIQFTASIFQFLEQKHAGFLDFLKAKSQKEGLASLDLLPAYQWNARDADPVLNLPAFNLEVRNYYLTDKIYIKLDAPVGNFYTYVLTGDDVTALGLPYDAATHTLTLNATPELMDAIERQVGAMDGLTPLSRCPVNRNRLCWGTTIGSKRDDTFTKPSDAIGEWTISVWAEHISGVQSNTVTGTYRVTTTLIGEH